MATGLAFPKLEICHEGEVAHGSRLILVAGGRAPDAGWLAEICRPCDTLWAVDRGLECCFEAGLIPDRLIGDLDSVSRGAIERGRELGVPMETFPVEKDLTDLQLALRIASRDLPTARIVLTGCWGGRFDHNFSNVYSPLWTESQGLNVLCMADEREALFFLRGRACVVFYPQVAPEAISLLALTPYCGKVGVSGVRWELSNKDLSLYKPFAISNKLGQGKESFRVCLEEGVLGVYLYWRVSL